MSGPLPEWRAVMAEEYQLEDTESASFRKGAIVGVCLSLGLLTLAVGGIAAWEGWLS